MHAHVAQTRYQLQRRIAGNPAAGDNAVEPANLAAVLHQLRHIANTEMVIQFEAGRARLSDLN